MLFENFRSLERVDLPLAPLTALVGPNGAGKTAVIAGIDMVLGNYWPSLRSVREPQDFTNFDATLTLGITVYGREPYLHQDALGATRPVQALRLVCKPYARNTKYGGRGDLHADFEPVGADGEVPNVAVTKGRGGTSFGRLSVGTDLRNSMRVLTIDHRRSVTQHLPTARHSVLARLFAPARKEFEQVADPATPGRAAFTGRYEEAMNALRTPRLLQVEATIRETTKRMLGFMGTGSKTADVAFGFADPANPFSSLRINYTEDGLTLPGEEAGMGVQSAIVVGIFEALRQLGSSVGTVLIEEPEMYLHPQAQRYFYRILTDLVGAGTQVIYSTHSPVFADVDNYEGIRLLRHHGKAHTSASRIVDTEHLTRLAAQKADQRLVTGFDTSKNELFFATRALLVEGPGDALAVRLSASQLGLDLDAANVAVVQAGGKSGLLFYGTICQALDIPFGVLHDDDQRPLDGAADGEQRAKIAAENRKEADLNDRVAALTPPLGLSVARPSLEAVLGIGRSATNKPAKVAAALVEREPADLPTALTNALNAIVNES